jgi:hypothetical protein
VSVSRCGWLEWAVVVNQRDGQLDVQPVGNPDRRRAKFARSLVDGER